MSRSNTDQPIITRSDYLPLPQIPYPDVVLYKFFFPPETRPTQSKPLRFVKVATRSRYHSIDVTERRHIVSTENPSQCILGLSTHHWRLR